MTNDQNPKDHMHAYLPMAHETNPQWWDRMVELHGTDGAFEALKNRLHFEEVQRNKKQLWENIQKIMKADQ